MSTYRMIRKIWDSEEPLPLIFGGVTDLAKASREYRPSRYHVNSPGSDRQDSKPLSRDMPRSPIWKSVVHKTDGDRADALTNSAGEPAGTARRGEDYLTYEVSAVSRMTQTR